MKEQIIKIANDLQNEMIILRRDFHKHAETGWTEFRTAAIVAKYLEDCGYKVLVGDEVMKEETIMALPPPEVLSQHMERARNQGAPTKYLDKMQGGKLGVVGILETGKPGPTIGFRFDMDANDLVESNDPEHRPVKEGFASINEGAMHGCGHDGHTAIGLGLAKTLMQICDALVGTIKLVFQPAEEGVRGAASMVANADDMDYIFGMHIGFKADKTGKLICGTNGFLATNKFDAIYKGVPAHAGAKPEEGKSALLAAAAATLAMQGIYRHSAGASRINIGVLEAGTGRNVVPDRAVIKLETRGETSEICSFTSNEAIRILRAASEMYDTPVEIKEMGGAVSADSDPEMVAFAREVAEDLGIFDDIQDTADLGASEDVTYFMNRVQENGGKASYLMVGADIAAGHHDKLFDFDEGVLTKSVIVLATMAHRLGQQ